jgi:arabinan endo-1,5-alpha-L-arabinosidase
MGERSLIYSTPGARMKNGMGRTPLGRVWRGRLSLSLSLALTGALLAACGAAAVPAAQTQTAARTHLAGAAGVPDPYIFVHDPSMARESGTYYLFSTGDPAGQIGNGNIQIRTSRNLRRWAYAGTVFADKPGWITAALGSIPNLWAPDISFFGGLWHLYYAGSSFGSNNSVIGLATTPTLNPGSPRYHWTDRGLVFRSTSSDDFNAIDPSVVRAAGGAAWLVFGSFWSGIKLLRLDAATGKPASAAPAVDSLAQRPAPDAEEGAGITYHDGYYYLLVSFDSCCQGIGSSYRIMVGRSASVTGPYVDPNGTSMMNAGGMELQGSDEAMIGPGSSSVYQDGSRSYLVYHYYDAFQDGDPWVQVRPLVWTSSGWPVTGQPLTPVPGSSIPLG